MVAKLKHPITLFVILAFALIAVHIPVAFCSEETEISDQAVIKLQQITCAQRDYYACKTWYFPKPTSKVQWNSPSIINSTNHLFENLRQASNYPIDPLSEINMLGQGGDVRFRCRNHQGGAFYCFAYRCKDKDPTGCKQMWRIEKASDDPNRGFKCTDVDRIEADGLCSKVNLSGGIESGYEISCDLPAPACVPE